MLYQKIKRFWINILPNKRKSIVLLVLAMLVLCTGCKQNTDVETEEDKTEQQIYEDSQKLAEGYRKIYETAVSQGNLNTLEVQKEIIESISSSGYAAVDRDDQINMVNYEQVEEFCKSADEGSEDHVTIISLLEEGDFVRYDMETKNGEIDVIVSTLRWEESKPQVCYYHEFTAYSWKYTKKGYFFIEEYHPPGYDGAPGELAFRVKPLDQTCREFNRKYVYAVGYERNKLLITDWNEQDYSALDFYDLYERLYYIKYGTYVPYEAYAGAEYEIPEQDFEEVIKSYFKIDREQIAENTMYDTNRKSYLYRPRGLHDAEQPYEPYPEVIAYEEQEDGTLRLFIEAVWEREMTDCAATSELVVRPLENGSYQYVSNQVTSWDEKLELSWYTPRLTDEQWQYYYENISNE